MPKPPTEDKPLRKVIALTPELWERVSDYRFTEKIPTEVEAIRRLLMAGLEALAAKR